MRNLIEAKINVYSNLFIGLKMNENVTSISSELYRCMQTAFLHQTRDAKCDQRVFKVL